MNVKFNSKMYGVPDPNICPHCHIVNKPKHIWIINSIDTDNKHNLITAWKCSSDSCDKIFLVNHKFEGNEFVFDRFLNGLPKGPDWPKPIKDLKNGLSQDDELQESKFIKTYLQSLVAENNGLDEIAGMGYRKAIEYLVKDWAIQENQDKKEEIEKSWLGVVIQNYYTGDLKAILERATWLGNDQAHYKKIFEEYNISDMKELIDLIMVELDRQFKMNHYIENIQKRK